MIRAWDPRTSYMFELKYVCNDQLNNSVVVTPHDGFEVTINPTPEVIKTAKSLCMLPCLLIRHEMNWVLTCVQLLILSSSKRRALV